MQAQPAFPDQEPSFKTCCTQLNCFAHTHTTCAIIIINKQLAKYTEGRESLCRWLRNHAVTQNYNNGVRMQMQLRFSVRAVPPGRERSAWRRRRRRGARVTSVHSARWSLQKSSPSDRRAGKLRPPGGVGLSDRSNNCLPAIAIESIPQLIFGTGCWQLDAGAQLIFLHL